MTFDNENLRNYAGNNHPTDVFAFSAYSMNITIIVDNSNFYGYILNSKLFSLIQYKNKVLKNFNKINFFRLLLLWLI